MDESPKHRKARHFRKGDRVVYMRFNNEPMECVFLGFVKRGIHIVCSVANDAGEIFLAPRSKVTLSKRMSVTL